MKTKSKVKAPDVDILQAARTLFSDRGFDSVSVDEIASMANVSRATVFNRFGSKQALVATLTSEVLLNYPRLIRESLTDRECPFSDSINTLFERMGNGIQDSRKYYRAIFQEIVKLSVGIEEGGPGAQARAEALDLLEQLATRGQARREVNPTLDPHDIALMFDSLIFGTISHWLISGSEAALTDSMHRVATIFLLGVTDHAQ